MSFNPLSPQKLTVFMIVLTSVLLTSCSFSFAEDIKPPTQQSSPVPVGTPIQIEQKEPSFPLVPPDPAGGVKIYAHMCLECHGEKGFGDGVRSSEMPNPVLAIGDSRNSFLVTPNDWFTIITDGNMDKFMPPFKNNLTDRERWDVLAYILSLGMKPAKLEQGKTVYLEKCASCHGETGNGDGPDAQTIALKPAQFTDQKYMASKSVIDFYLALDSGVHSGVLEPDGDITSEEAWAASTYLRLLSFKNIQASTGSTGEPTTSGNQAVEVTPTIDVIGEITGVVYHATNKTLPPDLEVALHGFDNMKETTTLSSKLNPDGSFLFPDVDLTTGRVFIASVEYDGVTYISDIMTIEQGTQSLEIPLVIYDTTSDVSEMVVNRLHIFFEFPTPGTIQLIQLYLISNQGQQTLIPFDKDTASLNFYVPSAATNLQFMDSSMADNVVLNENGFGYFAPIRPGSSQTQIIYSFELPYKKKTTLELTQYLPVNAAMVFYPEGSINLKTDGFVDNGIQQMQDTNYRVLVKDNLPVDSKLILNISGNPTVQTAQSSSINSTTKQLALGLGVLGFALAIAGGWLWRVSKQKPVDRPDDSCPEGVDDSDTIESVIDAIITIDDCHTNGTIPDEAYNQRRAELKSKLEALKSQQENKD